MTPRRSPSTNAKQNKFIRASIEEEKHTLEYEENGISPFFTRLLERVLEKELRKTEAQGEQIVGAQS
jgi:hypothetical protein